MAVYRSLLILLIVFSFGCQHRPSVRKMPVCFVSLELDYSQNIDGIIDTMEQYKYAALLGYQDEMKIQKANLFTKIGSCTCRNFDFMSGEFEGLATAYPLHFCKEITGVTRSEFLVDIQPWLKETRRFYEDMKKQAKKKGLEFE